MSSNFLSPENALIKAEDLCRVGQDEAALDILSSILGSRRSRTWQIHHQSIMKKFIELSVKLKRPVRDALVKYRNICQDAQIQSLEVIINEYRETSEKYANDAKALAASQNLEEAEDADFEDTPGSIMLQAVSGESAKDRKDQQILTPWVKYLWETYRTILDFLRNNNRLQEVYQGTARSAFRYCKTFKRPVEFRRLCDMLRKHLATITRYQNQNNSVDLNSSNTQRLYLETRFQQLEIASDLELWQEAYRTIEDIHESMNISQSPQAPTLMKVYYKQLAQIFWASENFLFHAYSLSKFYLLRCNEGMEDQEKTALASQVLLATLAIPPTRATDGDSMLHSDNEENLRLASMLGFRKETPTRQRLIDGLVNRGILSQVNEDVKTVYTLTETTFAPLRLTGMLLPIFDKLKAESAEWEKYVSPLYTLVVLRILQQLATVYKTMKITKFQSLLPEMHFHKLQRIIMVAVRKGEMTVSIDHRKQLLTFGDQSLEDTRFRSQLTELAYRLKTVQDRIASVNVEEKARERRRVFVSVNDGACEEHEKVFERKQEIEQRKQENEKKQQQQKEEEAARKAAAAKARAEEEAARLLAESKKREEERIKREQEQKELRDKQALAKQVNQQIAEQQESMGGKTTTKLKKLQALTDNVAGVNMAAMKQAQAEIKAQQKAEAERRTKELAKRADYLVRAIRIEEKPLLEKHMKDIKVNEEEAMEADFAKFCAVHQKAHERALAEKERLAKMMSDYKSFGDSIMAARKEKWAAMKKARDEKVVQLNKERVALIAEKRAAAEEKRAQEEADRRAEQERKAEEERKEQIKREEAAAKAQQDREARKKQDELSAKRREMEERAEAKLADKLGGGGGGTKWGDRADRADRAEEPRFGGRDRDREAGPRFGDRDREGGGRFDREGGGRFGGARGDREWGRGAREESGFRSNRGGDGEDGGRWGRGGDREESGFRSNRSGFGDRDRDRDGGRFGGRGDREEGGFRGGKDRDDGEKWGRGAGVDRGDRGFGAGRDRDSRQGGDRDRNGGRFGGGRDRDRDGDNGERWSRGGGGSRFGGDRVEDRGGDRGGGEKWSRRGNDDESSFRNRDTRRDEPRRDEPRRDEPRRDEPRRDEPRRDEPRRQPEEERSWTRGKALASEEPKESKTEARSEAPPAAAAPQEDDDGFTTVSKKKKSKKKGGRKR